MGTVLGAAGLEFDATGVFSCVDCVFFRVWSRCPFTIAVDCGGYLRRVCDVSPGRPWTYPLSNADCSVDRTGEKSAACVKATSSAGEADPVAELAMWSGSSSTGAGCRVHAVGVVGDRSKCHNFVFELRRPFKTGWLA